MWVWTYSEREKEKGKKEREWWEGEEWSWRELRTRSTGKWPLQNEGTGFWRKLMSFPFFVMPRLLSSSSPIEESSTSFAAVQGIFFFHRNAKTKMDNKHMEWTQHNQEKKILSFSFSFSFSLSLFVYFFKHIWLYVHIKHTSTEKGTAGPF